MPIAVQCSGCGGKFRAPDEAAGKRVKCPKCSSSFVIPASQAAHQVAHVWQKPPTSREASSFATSSPASNSNTDHFKVRQVQSALRLPGTISLEGEMLAGGYEYARIVELFHQHARDLGCCETPLVGICFSTYATGVGRKCLGCVAALGAMLVSMMAIALFFSLAGKGTAVAVITDLFGRGVAIAIGLVAAIVAYYKVTLRKSVKPLASAVPLPTVGKYALMHHDAHHLTLLPLVFNKQIKPPFFSCDRAIDIDMDRVSCQAMPATFMGFKTTLFKGVITLARGAPPLILDVIDKGVPPEVLKALQFRQV